MTTITTKIICINYIANLKVFRSNDRNEKNKLIISYIKFLFRRKNDIISLNEINEIVNRLTKYKYIEHKNDFSTFHNRIFLFKVKNNIKI